MHTHTHTHTHVCLYQRACDPPHVTASDELILEAQLHEIQTHVSLLHLSHTHLSHTSQGEGHCHILINTEWTT